MKKIFSQTIYDVAVVGSGPAGASAARALADRGAKVILIEKAKLPRYKTCGGGVVGRAVKSLPLDLRAVVERHCYQAQLHLRDAELNFSTIRTTPIVAMTMRAKLDELLAASAQTAGAELIDNCEVTDLIFNDREHDRKIELQTKQGVINARFVVAADGVMSAIARRAGWPETRELIPALECEVTVPDELLERFSQSACFDFGVVARGYGWVFPKRAHLSIGVLTMTRGSINLKQILQEYLRRLGIERVLKIEHHGALIPIAPRRDSFVRKRVILVGDVAGLADAVTGEGISYAIRSGQLAAQALITGELNEDIVRKVYQSALDKEILSELAAGRRLAKLLYGYPQLRERLFRRYGQKLSEAVTDLVMGEQSYQEILYRPSNYLKLFKI